MTTSTATISDLERFELVPATPLIEGVPFLAGRSGWAARVDIGDAGYYWLVSRLDGESAWFVDGVWTGHSPMPAFWNGRGARCTLLESVPAHIGADLDAAVEVAGVAR